MKSCFILSRNLIPEAHPAKFPDPLLYPLFRRHLAELTKRLYQLGLQQARSLRIIPVGPAQRLRNDAVDQAEFIHIIRSQTKFLGSLFLLIPAAPKDAAAIL